MNTNGVLIERDGDAARKIISEWTESQEQVWSTGPCPCCLPFGSPSCFHSSSFFVTHNSCLVQSLCWLLTWLWHWTNRH